MRRIEILERIRVSEPLISGMSLGNEDSLQKTSSLWFGVGLGSHKGLATKELPLDFLVMLGIAELLKRELELKEGYVLIADAHLPSTLPFYNPDKIQELAEERKSQITSICERLGFSGWKIFRASQEIPYETIMKEEKNAFKAHLPDYLVRELCDMIFLRAEKSLIKVGWSSKGMCLDERWYDGYYPGDDVSFVYTKPGQRIVGGAVPPYLHVGDPSERLLLRPSEEIKEKFERMPQGTKRFYAHLTNLLARLGLPLPGGYTQDVFTNPNLLQRRIEEIYKVVL
jgi:hypothetical protein